MSDTPKKPRSEKQLAATAALVARNKQKKIDRQAAEQAAAEAEETDSTASESASESEEEEGDKDEPVANKPADFTKGAKNTEGYMTEHEKANVANVRRKRPLNKSLLSTLW